MSTIATSAIRRQIGVYLGVTFTAVLALALAFPHAGLTPLLMMFTPTIGVAIAIGVSTPRGARAAAWRSIGFGPASWGRLAAAVALPAAVVATSFGIATAVGVVRFPGVPAIDPVQLAFELLVVGTLLALAEEIGWRGFLLPRLGELVPGGRAALLTGAAHAVFHLPALLLTTVYQSAGARIIVVPMVLVTITSAGVLYAWLRRTSGSIWPVALAHSTFNTLFGYAAMSVVAVSPAAMAYVTTETGVVTMLISVATAAWLLTHRAGVLDRPRETAGR